MEVILERPIPSLLQQETDSTPSSETETKLSVKTPSKSKNTIFRLFIFFQIYFFSFDIF